MNAVAATLNGPPTVAFVEPEPPAPAPMTLPDRIAAEVSAAGLGDHIVSAIRRTAERVVDIGEAAKAATLETDELIAVLKEADTEAASFDAIYDQEILVNLLRRESDPPPAFRQLRRIKREKEAAIEAQDFPLAADLREHEREIVRAHEPRIDDDALWRLRRNGLVERFSSPPKLTPAGRRLASSLL